MVAITTRAAKGSALTHNEVDANFTNLADAVDTFGGVGRYTTTIGNGVDTTFTITHNLGTEDVVIQIRPNNAINGIDFPPFVAGGGAWSVYDQATGNYGLEISEDFSSRINSSITLLAEFIDISGAPVPFSNILPTAALSVTVIGGGATAVDVAAYDAVVSEVETARGDRSNLNNRITTISNFASPNAGGIVVGNYYDNAFQGTASGTLAGAANRVVMAPFYTSERMRIDQLGIAISAAVASSTLRCFIYGSDASGWPDELLYVGDSDLSGATTGYKSHTLDFTFDSGRQYWVGVRMNSTATYRAISV